MSKREELYESLVRLTLMLIFAILMTVGTFGLISISQMLLRSQVTWTEPATYALADSQ